MVLKVNPQQKDKKLKNNQRRRRMAKNKIVPLKRPPSTDKSDHIYGTVAKSNKLNKTFKEGYG